MAYATSASISDRYGANYLVDVSDRDDDDVSDAGAVIEAIEDAASEIDGYIGQRYPLPLAKVPAWLVRCNVDLAVYELASEGRLALTDEMTAKRIRWVGDGDDVKGFLEKLVDGEVGLGLGADEPDTTSEPAFYSDDQVLTVSQTRGPRMMVLELEGTEKLYRTLGVLESFPTQEFMRGLVDLTIAQARERFDTKEDPEGQAWKSWSAGYRAAGAPFHSKHTLLHLSGDMMNSIQAGAVTRDHATIEVPVPYAGRQNEERQFLGFIDNDPRVEDYAVDFMVSRMGDA